MIEKDIKAQAQAHAQVQLQLQAQAQAQTQTQTQAIVTLPIRHMLCHNVSEVNVALGKSATASSNAAFTSIVVDGDTGVSYASDCWVTESSHTDNWWMVDLEQTYIVEYLMIYHNDDSVGKKTVAILLSSITHICFTLLISF